MKKNREQHGSQQNHKFLHVIDLCKSLNSRYQIHKCQKFTILLSLYLCHWTPIALMRTWTSWRQAPFFHSFYTKVDLTQCNHSKNICWIKLPPNLCLCFQAILLYKILPVLLQKYNSDNVTFIVLNVHIPWQGILCPQPVFPVSFPAFLFTYRPSPQAMLTVPWTLLDFHYSMPLQMLFPLSESSFPLHLPSKLIYY